MWYILGSIIFFILMCLIVTSTSKSIVSYIQAALLSIIWPIGIVVVVVHIIRLEIDWRKNDSHL